MFTDIRICLASTSPRRQELLRQIGVEFEVSVPDITEERMDAEKPDAYALRLARDKARVVWQRRAAEGSDLPVLGADTCVVVDDLVLGKPQDHKHARQMLKHLSGRDHEVITAIVLKLREKEYSAISTSVVTMEKLSNQVIDNYCRSGEPADKAGAYAIQGVAAGFISHIEGSYSGIVGLPLFELVQGFKHFGLVSQ